MTATREKPMITPELKVLIVENLERKLGRDDSINLRAQIRKIGLEYGTTLDDCTCPKCKKNLMFTFAYGPACLITYELNVKSGCGYTGRDLISKD